MKLFLCQEIQHLLNLHITIKNILWFYFSPRKQKKDKKISVESMITQSSVGWEITKTITCSIKPVLKKEGIELPSSTQEFSDILTLQIHFYPNLASSQNTHRCISPHYYSAFSLPPSLSLFPPLSESVIISIVGPHQGFWNQWILSCPSSPLQRQLTP